MSEQLNHYNHTEADDTAEAKVDAIPQEQFDAFGPRSHPIEYESTFTRVAKQTATRIDHAIWEGTGSRSAQDSESKARRDKEREKVGLPPKYHQIAISGRSQPAELIEVHKA